MTSEHEFDKKKTLSLVKRARKLLEGEMRFWMGERQKAITRFELKYGFGTCIVSYDDKTECFGHYGSYPGFRSVSMYNPDYKYSIAMQINTEVKEEQTNACLYTLIPIINNYIVNNKL